MPDLEIGKPCLIWAGLEWRMKGFIVAFRGNQVLVDVLDGLGCVCERRFFHNAEVELA